MKKILKISTVFLIIFALVSNLYTALFSFYGIKTNNLAGSVLANGLATTDNTSGTSGTSSNGSSGTWFNEARSTTIWCGQITYTTGYSGSNTGGASGMVTNPSGSVVAGVSGGYVNSTSTSGTIAAHSATEIRCTGPLAWTFCSSQTGIDACQ